MDSDSYRRQIKQMVGFILQEAKEKANEIYVVRTVVFFADIY